MMFGDENRWESFLRKDDERVTRYMKLLHRFMAENPMPPAEDKNKRAQWDTAFRAFLGQHGWMRDEIELSSFLSDSDETEGDTQEHFDLIEEDGDLLEEENSFERLERLPVYQSAYQLTRTVLKWSDGLPGSVKDSTLVQFCASIMQISSNVAKGHGIGYEHDMIGGNIACLKRGITAANAALELLRELKTRSYMREATYRDLYEHTYEVRNQVGVYIQDLRDQFNLGID